VPLESLRRTDLEAWISPRFIERGEGYRREGRVLARKRRADGPGAIVTGRVRGSQGRIYSVHVALGPGPRGNVDIIGDCSCPVSFNCKHVAAVLLAEIDGRASGAAATPAAAPAVAPGAGADPALEAWLSRLARAREQADPAGAPASEPYRVLYLLDEPDPYAAPGRLHLALVVCRILKSGDFGKPAPFNAARAWQPYPPRFLDARDLEALRALGPPPARGVAHAFTLDGAEGARALAAALATGRCRWREAGGPVLEAGEAREARFVWRLGVDVRQHLMPDLDPAPHAVAAVAPPWYVDLDARCCGPLETGLAPEVAAALAAAPALDAGRSIDLPGELAEILDAVGVPRPPRPQMREIPGPPVPRLRLLPGEAVDPVREADAWWWTPSRVPPRAELRFGYGAHVLRPASEYEHQVLIRDGDAVARVRRDHEAEDAALEALYEAGLVLRRRDPFELDPGDGSEDPPCELVADDSGWEGADRALPWLAFLRDQVPALRDRGWVVEVDPDFDHRLLVPERIVGELAAAPESGRWFDVDLGIVVDGETIPLLPLLHRLLAGPGARQVQAALDAGDPRDDLLVQRADGAWLSLPGERVRAIVDTLVELHDPELRLRDGALRVAGRRAGELAALAGSGGVRWRDAAHLAALAERVRGFEGVSSMAAPSGFAARLRPYQEHGLGWLQFLRELDFGGILADDMGLGKTVQVLAHLLAEKGAGRLDRPSLVVAPTSVLANWSHETRRFAPALRAAVLHGADRARQLADLGGHDLAITSYALAHRDREALAAQPWHLLVLDEAQAVKNPRTKARQALHALDARHRLCLTGTPLENHLGELWSLVDFVEPGLLGDVRQFRRLFRTPIEKAGDGARRDALARRIAPVVLRRTKDAVAPELPEKVEIEQVVELHPEQRDVYESIRLAMHERVHEALAARGLDRSRVVVLDALLKLRQICCDPRLVKLDAVRRIRRSAKLERLMEMLPAMVEEGRRVLLFSQFTSMLALIEDALAATGIEYLQLTGRTRDRDTPVRRFQAGEVPLFLVSLKAGGTGLNLTAADTVIHYDPWWNPAVENQATDRAHRIGQQHKVFVYRLVAEGTVEQRMLHLKARKRALADSMLAGSGPGGGVDLSSEDLEYLLEPLGA